MLDFFWKKSHGLFYDLERQTNGITLFMIFTLVILQSISFGLFSNFKHVTANVATQSSKCTYTVRLSIFLLFCYFQLSGNCHGFSHSLEFNISNGGCILSVCEASISSTRNIVNCCNGRLGMIDSSFVYLYCDSLLVFLKKVLESSHRCYLFYL